MARAGEARRASTASIEVPGGFWGGALLRLDRRPSPSPRRRQLPTALYPATEAKRLVKAKRRASRAPDWRRADEADRQGRGRPGTFRWTLASCLRRFCNDRDAGRSRGSARSRAEGGGNVRASHQPEPLRNPLPTRHRKAAGHTLAPPYDVRRNAGARRNDLPTAA